MKDCVIDTMKNYLLKDFYSFFVYFWPVISPDEYVDSRHIELIADELQKVGDDILCNRKPEYDWYIINVPPGSSKSSLVSVMFPTWLIANNQSKFIISTSYSAQLANDFIRKSVKILDDESFRQLFGDIRSSITKCNEDRFETSTDGGRFSTSTGGTITGYHGNVIIADDPLSVEQSYSKAERDRAIRYIRETLPSRKRIKDKTPIILIMQRLHEEDPTGVLLEMAAEGKISVKHICLPAEIGGTITSTHNHIYQDGLLDPVRLSREILQGQKDIMLAQAYAGQYLQRPQADGGNIVKAEWFSKTTIDAVPKYLVWDMWVDGAYTDKTKNDPTGIAVIGFDRIKAMIYVRCYHEAYMTMPDLINFLPVFAAENGIDYRSRVYIEPKATGLSLEQFLRNSRLNPVLIRGHLVGEGKNARIETAAPSMQVGKWLLMAGGWNDTFINQLIGFPGAKHDEVVDICGYAAEEYFSRVKNPLGIKVRT